jgi:type IV pilus assembly protein PilY1
MIIFYEIVILAIVLSGQALAAALTFSKYPLEFINTSQVPNILILYDNSYSMDGEIDPLVMVGGGDPNSRSNLVRNALRPLISNYASNFNWGIEVFNTNPTKDVTPDCDSNYGNCGIFLAYQGSSSTMVFTNDCINGISASNGGLKCMLNPEPNNGYNYITYDPKWGDTYTENNYLIGPNYLNFVWGTPPVGDSSGKKIDLFLHHNSVTTWQVSSDNATSYSTSQDFIQELWAGENPIGFSGCIDSGGSSGCSSAFLTRALFSQLPIGYVYLRHTMGSGSILEPIASNASSNHQTNLFNAFQPETNDINTKEIKNFADQTPTAGAFITAKQYFSGALTGFTSPIQGSCQKNYVILATDGYPTMSSAGSLYSDSQMSNATSGKAYTDVYSEITALRSLSVGSNNYDIKTFIVGVGGDVANASSDPVPVQGLNLMASYGGTQQAYLANDQSSISSAFQSILNSIQYQIPIVQSNGHIAVGATSTSQNVSVYKAFFSSNGWQGNLIASTPSISIANSVVSYDTGSTPKDFSTGAAQWLVDNTVNGKSRQIITSMVKSDNVSMTGAAFQWDSLNATTQNMLINSGETAIQGTQRLNYIRGDRSNELSNSNPNGFRARATTVLGDIIDSSPVYVGASSAGYSDSDFPTGMPSYSVYMQSTKSRRPMVYIGANDGMLHGFDATTLQEVFSYIPNSVFSKFIDFSSQSYTHDFFVDETPIVADIPVSGKWVTQLIGFAGMGGTGLFALDITSPTNLAQAESNANSIVLWELNSKTDNDIGYILNRGQINQQRGNISRQIGQMANKRWAIVTGNGYNAPNNSTGLLIHYLDNAEGKPAYNKIMIPGATGGLSTPTLLDADDDGIIDFAYAGDLQGNVWRFDLRGEENKWSSFQLFLPTAGWAIAPITTAPAIAHNCSQPGYIVVVGTGKYLEAGDNTPSYTDNHDDYLLGLWDKMDNSQITMNNLAQQWYYKNNTFINPNSDAPPLVKNLIMSSDNSVDWTTQQGWALPLYYNYPTPARIVVPPYIADGLVYFNTITPSSSLSSSSSCGGPINLLATTQALNVCTGGRPQAGVFDINFDGSVNGKDQYNLWGGSPVNVTGVDLQSQGRIYDPSVWIMPQEFVCATPPCDTLNTSLSDSIGVNYSKIQPKRLTWKEIQM